MWNVIKSKWKRVTVNPFRFGGEQKCVFEPRLWVGVGCTVEHECELDDVACAHGARGGCAAHVLLCHRAAE